MAVFLTSKKMWLILLIALFGELFAQQALDYPKAKRVNQVDNYHGTEVVDPYRWMEEMESPDTKRWIDRQETLLNSYLGEDEIGKSIARRILAIRSIPRIGTPIAAGGNYFYTKTAYGETQAMLYIRESLSAPEKVLYNPFEHLKNSPYRFTGFTVSPGGKYVTLSFAEGQSVWQHLLVMRVDSGKILADTLKEMRAGINWRKDDAGFFYARYPAPGEGQEMTATLENPQIFYHRIGSSGNDDRLIFAMPEHPEWLIGPQVSTDGRYLVINVAAGSSFSGMVDQIYYLDLKNESAGVKLLMPQGEGQYSFEGNNGEEFWFQSTLDAPRRRLVAVNINKPQPQHWQELVAQSDAPLNTVSIIGKYFVMRYTRDALPVIRVHHQSGKFAYEVKMPSIALVGGLNDNPDSHEAFYSLWGLYETGTTYRLDVASGKNSLFQRPKTAHNPDDFVMKQIFYRSKDGTRVPMIIAHHRDTHPSADTPVFMYGYGALAWSALPWYQPHVVTWTEMGGIYALPGIRGGGEYGQDWYHDGIGKKKQNGIDDYLAAAEWLIKNNYTSSKRLIANGGSASGMLAGAAVIQRPELFGAAVIDIPRFDMLRYHLFTGGTSRVNEIGSPDDPAYFPVIHDYSPYHNIKPGACYPPTLVIAGEKDEVAPPLHAYKFIARMQSEAACANPALLKIVRGAGHSYGTTHAQNAETWSQAWHFLIKTLDLKFEPEKLAGK